MRLSIHLFSLLFLIASFNSKACTSFNLDYTFTCANPGDMITVTWTSTGCAPGQLVDISVVDNAANATVQYFPNEANTGSFTLTLSPGLALGMHRMYIQTAGWPPTAWHNGPNFEVKATVPVQWEQFECRKTEKDQIALEWMTSSEVNNVGFEIHKSYNSFDWIELDFVNGANNSATSTNYSYVDRSPENGVNYYRLKQMDWDGASNYSPTVSINYREKKEPKIYPVHVQDVISIELEGAEKASLYIYNTSGQLLAEHKLKGSLNGPESVDVSNLQSQVLLTRIDWDGKSTSKKLIKI